MNGVFSYNGRFIGNGYLMSADAPKVRKLTLEAQGTSTASVFPPVNTATPYTAAVNEYLYNLPRGTISADKLSGIDNDVINISFSANKYYRNPYVLVKGENGSWSSVNDNKITLTSDMTACLYADVNSERWTAAGIFDTYSPNHNYSMVERHFNPIITSKSNNFPSELIDYNLIDFGWSATANNSNANVIVSSTNKQFFAPESGIPRAYVSGGFKYHFQGVRGSTGMDVVIAWGWNVRAPGAFNRIHYGLPNDYIDDSLYDNNEFPIWDGRQYTGNLLNGQGCGIYITSYSGVNTAVRQWAYSTAGSLWTIGSGSYGGWSAEGPCP